ncbi:MAG: lysophospholipid acyltransferase family protein [Promethearchaeota archaeon]
MVETTDVYKTKEKYSLQSLTIDSKELKESKTESKKFADLLPKLLENNLFDRAITQFRRWADIFNIIDAVDNIVYWNSYTFLRLAFKILFNWHVYGSLNFPEFGPALLISNHQSVLDPFLIAAGVPREIRWMSKIENFEMPIFKSILSFYGTFAVNRTENPKVTLDKAIEILEKGDCVGMFPGGTRSPTPEINPKWKTGAARIILKAKVPYIPVCILGSHYVLPKNSIKLNLHKVEIRIGEPVWHEDLWNRQYTEYDIKMIRDEMWNKVNDLMNAEIDPVKKVVITKDHPDLKYKKIAEQFDLSIS